MGRSPVFGKCFMPWSNDDFDVEKFFGSDKNSNLFKSLSESFETVFGDARYTNDNGDIVYEIEAPGFNKDNVNVEISNGVLIVTGERDIGDKQTYAGQKKIFKRISIGNLTDIEAIVEDGILTITIKMPEKDVTIIGVK